MYQFRRFWTHSPETVVIRAQGCNIVWHGSQHHQRDMHACPTCAAGGRCAPINHAHEPGSAHPCAAAPPVFAPIVLVVSAASVECDPSCPPARLPPLRALAALPAATAAGGCIGAVPPDGAYCGVLPAASQEEGSKRAPMMVVSVRPAAPCCAAPCCAAPCCAAPGALCTTPADGPYNSSSHCGWPGRLCVECFILKLTRPRDVYDFESDTELLEHWSQLDEHPDTVVTAEQRRRRHADGAPSGVAL